MSFTFNFSGGDIDDEDGAAKEPTTTESKADEATTKEPAHPEVPVIKHNLKDLLSTLPGTLAYTTTHLLAPHSPRQTLLPRRALFDVRMQLMSEDDTSSTHDMLTSSRDITASVYEGGFKTWEGAHDLARLLLERGPRRDIDEIAGLSAVVELGCGAALPALVLFQHALVNEYAPLFVLADYNADVLRLLTLPNLLLTWAMHAAPDAMRPTAPTLDADGNVRDGDGDLDVTPGLLARFAEDLERRGLDVMLLSGPWSAALTAQITAPLPADGSVLVLGAETVYSPASMDAFADTLRDVMGHVKAGKAYVAAKRVYFGVGGGVDAFKESMARRGGIVSELMGTGIEACERGVSGVGRCLLEVQTAL